jgi:hypothetical protein
MVVMVSLLDAVKLIIPKVDLEVEMAVMVVILF